VVVIVAALGLLDLIQALVRIWRPEYTNGLPSFAWLLLIYVFGVLGCAALLGEIGETR